MAGLTRPGRQPRLDLVKVPDPAARQARHWPWEVGSNREFANALLTDAQQLRYLLQAAQSH